MYPNELLEDLLLHCCSFYPWLSPFCNFFCPTFSSILTFSISSSPNILLSLLFLHKPHFKCLLNFPLFYLNLLLFCCLSSSPLFTSFTWATYTFTPDIFKCYTTFQISFASLCPLVMYQWWCCNRSILICPIKLVYR